MVWGVRARGMVLAVVVAGSLLAVCSSAYATAIAPNTTSDVVGDDGVCSLREAITAAALQTPSGAKPGECPAGAGILNGGTLTLSNSVITGNATGNGGNGGAGIGTSKTNALAIGGAGGAGGSGGGIKSVGPLTVTNSVITANSTGGGGIAGVA